MDIRLSAALQTLGIVSGGVIGWQLAKIVTDLRRKRAQQAQARRMAEIWNNGLRDFFTQSMRQIDLHNREVARMHNLHIRFDSGVPCWCGSGHVGEPAVNLNGLGHIDESGMQQASAGPPLPQLTPEDIQRMNDLANGKP